MSKITITQEHIDKISSFFSDVGINITIRDDYSGRGMYNATCFAIITDEDAFSIGYAFGRLDKEDEDNGGDGIFSFFSEYPPKVDNMGKSLVYYWPQIGCKPLDD